MGSVMMGHVMMGSVATTLARADNARSR